MSIWKGGRKKKVQKVIEHLTTSVYVVEAQPWTIIRNMKQTDAILDE